MNRLFRGAAPALGLALSVSLQDPAYAQADLAPDSVAIGRVVDGFHSALAAGDSLAALDLLAPDVIVLEAGGAESRAEYHSHHLPADIAFARAVPSQRGGMRIRQAGTVAWVTSVAESEGTLEGRAIRTQGAELMVLARSPDGWRIRAIHWSSRRRP